MRSFSLSGPVAEGQQGKTDQDYDSADQKGQLLNGADAFKFGRSGQVSNKHGRNAQKS